MQDHQELDIIEGMDEDGNRLFLSVDRYFFYNGEEYVLLHEAGTDSREDATRYVMRVQVVDDNEGEEMEEFLPVEPDLMAALIHMASADYSLDEEIVLDEDADKA